MKEIEKRFVHQETLWTINILTQHIKTSLPKSSHKSSGVESRPNDRTQSCLWIEIPKIGGISANHILYMSYLSSTEIKESKSLTISLSPVYPHLWYPILRQDRVLSFEHQSIPVLCPLLQLTTDCRLLSADNNRHTTRTRSLWSTAATSGRWRPRCRRFRRCCCCSSCSTGPRSRVEHR